MVRLGDYLGNLLAEITMARVQADLEAVRVAEMYVGHPLLKHMPVPHFRLPTVELDLPVTISGMEDIDQGEGERRDDLDPAEMAKSFTDLLDKVLNENEADLTDAEQSALQAKLETLIKPALDPRNHTRGSLTGVVNDLLDAALTPLENPKRKGGAIAGEKLEKVREELKRRVMIGFLKLQSAPPRLEAEMNTKEVAGSADRHLLARIKMKVSEEGMEWARVETEDGVEDRLVAE